MVCTVPLTERNCYQHKQMVVHSIRPNVTAGLTVEGDTQWSKDTLRESPCLSIFFCLRFCIFYGDFHWLVAKPSQGSIFHKKGAFVVARLNVGTPHTRLTIVVDILVTVALEALVVIASLALLLLVSVLEASRLLQTKNESSFRPE